MCYRWESDLPLAAGLVLFSSITSETERRPTYLQPQLAIFYYSHCFIVSIFKCSTMFLVSHYCSACQNVALIYTWNNNAIAAMFFIFESFTQTDFY